MFKSSQVLQLFPVFVWAQVLEDEVAGPLNEHLVQQAAALKPASAESLPPNTGWQTRNDLQTLPEFGEMTEIINAATQKVLQFLQVEPAPTEITGCWMNIKPTGVGHPLHGHPNNYLSGVYYVKAPKGSDSILFHDFRMDRIVISPRYIKEVPQNSSLARIPIAENLLIMFPAWLPHSVAANPTPEERVSLSFNIMFSDFTQTLAKPNWAPGEPPPVGYGP